MKAKQQLPTLEELKAQAKEHAANYTKMNAAKTCKALNNLGIACKIEDGEIVTRKTNKSGTLITKTTRKPCKRIVFELKGHKYNYTTTDGIGLAQFLAAHL